MIKVKVNPNFRSTRIETHGLTLALNPEPEAAFMHSLSRPSVPLREGGGGGGGAVCAQLKIGLTR